MKSSFRFIGRQFERAEEASEKPLTNCFLMLESGKWA